MTRGIEAPLEGVVPGEYSAPATRTPYTRTRPHGADLGWTSTVDGSELLMRRGSQPMLSARI